jgi:hypothetical protein
MGSNIAIQKFDHGFLFVFNTYYMYMMHRLKLIPYFLIVAYGGMWILTARWLVRPEMRSPVDRATTVLHACFVDNYRLSCNVSTLFALFSLPQMAERRFWPLGGVLDRKGHHQSIP